MKILEEYQKKVGVYPLAPAMISSEKATKDIVYLLFNELTNLYKIGITYDLYSRRLSVQSSCGSKLKIVGFLQIEPGYDEPAETIEKFCHHYFKSKRTFGEWFALSKKDIAELRCLALHIEGADFWMDGGDEERVPFKGIFDFSE